MWDPSVVVLAHPLTQQAELPVSPLVLALLAVYVLVMVAAIARRRPKDAAEGTDPAPVHDLQGWAPDGNDTPADLPARTLFWVLRTLGLALFVLVVIAARLGSPNQLINIAPALTIGAGWPLVVIGALVIGPVWWWINPFDTLARPLSVLGAGDGSAKGDDRPWGSVWWAVVPALLWMLYLTAWPSGLAPRSIGWTLITYALVTLAGCLALGRRTWLWRGEFFTVFFGLLGALRRHGARWTPPPGAAALLGVVAGGTLFGLVRVSDLAGFLAYGLRADPYAWIVGLGVMALAGVLSERGARRAAPAVLVVALVPLTGALVLALSLSRNRFTTSLQLLPILASNPFGGNLNLFGTATNGINPAPLGLVGTVWLQAALLVSGAVAGVLLGLRAGRRSGNGLGRLPSRRTTGVVLGVVGTFLALGVAAAAAI